jgi:HD-GYP domain-containing protein (c-di-GMP phosphodiesterase class II)
VFHLDNPSSQGPFVLAFHQQKPFLVNDVGEIEEKLTQKSRMFMQKLSIRSFLCCPIIVEGDSLGILAVTNQTTKRTLVNSDVALLMGVSPVIGVALQNASLVEKLQSTFEKTLKILADSIDARDFLTAGHSEVVAEYAAGIAEAMDHDSEFVQMIRVAALLHDYGKIGVPDAILKKDGQLTDEERAIINTHPAKTREILSQVPFQGIQMQIPEITGAHHERWDGNGYPQGLKGSSKSPGRADFGRC